MCAAASVTLPQEIRDVRKILWGEHIKGDLFQRWSQGFTCSPEECSALVQRDGGPCAVIAPVQAFIVKQILMDEKAVQNNEWRQVRVYTCLILKKS